MVFKTGMNREGGLVSNHRPMTMHEPLEVAEPCPEFWSERTGASKIGNRFLTPFPWLSILLLSVRQFRQAVVCGEQFHLLDGDLIEAGEAFGLG